MTSTVPMERITNKIYLIHGQKVMLDRELAELYVVETRVLNQAVRRNIKRFPPDFMFSLTREEIMNLSQIVISSRIKHAPNVFVFTEQGVAMLSSVLNSERAVQVNIAIMRAFTKLREMLSTHDDLKKKIEAMEKKYDQQFQVVFEAIKPNQDVIGDRGDIMNKPGKKLTFSRLVTSIRQIHDQMAAQAGKAVNVSLTLRN